MTPVHVVTGCSKNKKTRTSSKIGILKAKKPVHLINLYKQFKSIKQPWKHLLSYIIGEKKLVSFCI